MFCIRIRESLAWLKPRDHSPRYRGRRLANSVCIFPSIVYRDHRQAEPLVACSRIHHRFRMLCWRLCWMSWGASASSLRGAAAAVPAWGCACRGTNARGSSLAATSFDEGSACASSWRRPSWVVALAVGFAFAEERAYCHTRRNQDHSDPGFVGA